ncbi:MAG: transporter substrate-binding domain-containing protein [Sinobacteraceae bacterium]|nr:transporter substrate-binding domain-containing protein [Nevskiaceae bacterium]
MTDFRKKLLGSCASLSVAAVLLYGGAAGAATSPLSVCVDKASPTSGVAQQLAAAVAKQEGRKLKIHEFDSNAGEEGFDVHNFAKLATKDCDLVMGFPLDTDAKRVYLPGVQMTQPYAHTGFVLVATKASGVKKLEDLPKGSLVGVTYLTTPNIYFRSYPELQSEVGLNTKASVNSLVDKKVSAAMLWRPAVVQELDARGMSNDYIFTALGKPHSTFNIVALYTPKHKKDSTAFNKAVISLEKSGELASILGQYAEPGPQPGSNAGNVKVAQTTSAGKLQVGDAFAAHHGDGTSDSGASRKTDGKKKAGKAGGAKPAIYTAAQADVGAKLYAGACARCHGKKLEGFVGPALKGRHFAPASFDFHVKDIFMILSNNMPADQPGTMSHESYVQIMAFLLQQNGYPAGDKKLTFGGALRSTVPFVTDGGS